MITTKKADKLIEKKSPATFYNEFYHEQFTAVLVSRDRYQVTTEDGAVYSRDELIVISE